MRETVQRAKNDFSVKNSFKNSSEANSVKIKCQILIKIICVI